MTPFLEYPQTSKLKSEEEQRRLQIPDEKFNMPVEQLDLSVRTMNCLRRAGIATVGELISKGERKLLSLRNFGQKSKIELEEKLGAIDLTLTYGDDDEEGAPAEDEATADDEAAADEVPADVGAEEDEA